MSFDGFRGDPMGFLRVLHVSRRNLVNKAAMFISRPRFPSDLHEIPSEKMEKHTAISGIHMDSRECPVEQLGIPADKPGFRTKYAGFPVNTGPIPHAALEIPSNPLPVRPEPPEIQSETERFAATPVPYWDAPTAKLVITAASR